MLGTLVQGLAKPPGAHLEYVRLMTPAARSASWTKAGSLRSKCLHVSQQGPASPPGHQSVIGTTMDVFLQYLLFVHEILEDTGGETVLAACAQDPGVKGTGRVHGCLEELCVGRFIQRWKFPRVPVEAPMASRTAGATENIPVPANCRLNGAGLAQCRRAVAPSHL